MRPLPCRYEVFSPEYEFLLDIIPNPRSRSRFARAAQWVRDLLRYCLAEAKKLVVWSCGQRQFEW